MFQTHVSCHLWDFSAEGIDTVLDRLRGEAGATGVSVTVCAPSVALFRPHAGVTPRTFRSEGGLQFQPDKSGYESTRLRPVVAEWLRKVNPLAAVAEACTRLGLTLRGRVVCCHSEVLASRFEMAAVKNVFGDVHPAWLCPSNLDVREYLRAVIGEASAAYPFETLEVEAAAFPLAASAVAGPAAAEGAALLGLAGEWLRALCFCESCRQAAAAEGVDAAAAARSASVILEKALAAGEPVGRPVEGLLAGDAILRAYAAWRGRQVTRLVEALRSSCRCRMVVVHAGGWAEPGSDCAALRAHGDALLTQLPLLPAEEFETALQAASTAVGGAAGLELAVDARMPACPDSATLVRALSAAARLGVSAAVVDNYGQLPLPRLAWIKQAARYASREAL